MSDLYNTVLLFKDEDPRMKPFAGTDGEPKIFFHSPACLGERSYGIRHINKIFEEGINDAGLQKLLVWMMEYLQAGAHSGEWPGPAGEYPYASEEYPRKYLTLVEGLSARAIEIISAMNTASAGGEIKEDMGRKFCEKLLADRKKLLTPIVEVNETIEATPDLEPALAL